MRWWWDMGHGRIDVGLAACSAQRRAQGHRGARRQALGGEASGERHPPPITHHPAYPRTQHPYHPAWQLADGRMTGAGQERTEPRSQEAVVARPGTRISRALPAACWLMPGAAADHIVN